MIKRQIILGFCLLIALASCSGDKPHEAEVKQITREAKGGRVYGGAFRFGTTEICQTLYPPKITDATSALIANQVYEGLVKFNTQNLTIVPSLAEKWDIDSSGTLYTFHLRKGVKFHNDACFPEGKGRELKASDVLYSFELLCRKSPDNVNFGYILKDRVKGANEYYEASKKGKPSGNLEGLKVIDDYTISIRLLSPSSSFLYILTHSSASIVAKEAVEKYGTDMKIGTGPFIVADISKPTEQILLLRNENYYGMDSLGNRLPFLDTLVICSYATKVKELEQFQSGPISFIRGLPSESIKDMVENQISDFNQHPPKYILDRSPEMSTQYYTFNSSKEPFNKLKVRQAFSYAINRSSIVDNVLRGEAFGPGTNGICPPSFKGYDVAQIPGYPFNPAKAKQLMAEAGYPDGKGFPIVKLKLNSAGSRNTSVVIEVQKQLHEVLGVNVDFDVVSFKQRIEDEAHGNGNMFHSAWIADYPSPENFLWLFYGKTVPENPKDASYPNSARYKNKDFDKLFEAGRAARTQEEAYKNFREAETLLMADAPILVLWYNENWRLTKSNVHNFYGNPMAYYDFSEVYLKTLVAGDKAEAGKK
ncbi:MAG TPA: ABC transporter substrate-binding protein [Bacteroidia bacterium]|nr:ABC transporter substrate-binding protein [Bacteroidia bacterium]